MCLATMNLCLIEGCLLQMKTLLKQFLAALAALYLTLVSQWVGDCHFRIQTQRVTFET